MYIKVKVIAGAKKELIERVSEDTLHISVREEAEMNQANRRVLAIVRELYPMARDVRLVSGHHSPAKIVSVDIGD